MSYSTKTVGAVTTTISIEYRLIVADVAPTPASGYEITQIADLGELGKVFMEYKLTTA